MNDRVQLDSGYEGAHARFKAAGDESDTAVQMARQQAGTDFEGPNKGNLAKAGQNNSQALAETFGATGNLHGDHANRAVNFVNQTVGFEDDATGQVQLQGQAQSENAGNIQKMVGGS